MIAAGSKIYHSVYGDGIVIEIRDGKYLDVKFQDVKSIKTFQYPSCLNSFIFEMPSLNFELKENMPEATPDCDPAIDNKHLINLSSKNDPNTLNATEIKDENALNDSKRCIIKKGLNSGIVGLIYSLVITSKRKMAKFLALALIVGVIFVLHSTSRVNFSFTKDGIDSYVGRSEFLDFNIDDSTDKIEFISSNEAVVNVSDEGYCTMISAGTATIAVKQNNRLLDTITVDVHDIDLEKIELLSDVVSIGVNNEKSLSMLRYSIYPENATDKAVDFWILDNDIAQIREGKLIGIAAGETTIYATHGNEVYDSAKLLVQEIPVDDIFFENFSVEVGERFSPVVTIQPENASCKTYRFESSNESVAVVRGSYIYGISEGSSNITVKSANGNAYSCKIIVSPIKPERMEIRVNNSMLVGTSTVANVLFFPANTTYNDVTWKSSDSNIVAVSSDGKVVAKGAGSTFIIATHKSGMSAACKIEVNPIEVSSILITGNRQSIFTGETLQLGASIFPENATYKELKWSTSNGIVAKVDEKGKVTAVGGGPVTITATAKNGKSASYFISVKPTSKQMTVTVTAECISNNSVGNEWSEFFSINGKEISTNATINVTLNSSLSVYTKITEQDSYPDVGSAKYSLKVGENEFENGFSITQTIIVKEQRGRYSGNSAKWEITYEFR